MNRHLSIASLAINFILALMISFAFSTFIEINPVMTAVAITAVSASIEYFSPGIFSGKLMAGLQKEVWVAGIKENPVPNTSFVAASTDMSEYVENNKLHLAEAGVDPGVNEDYFAGNEDPLPIATTPDIPNEVVLRTYSTDQTRHRDLQEIELAYNRRQSVINRHRNSLTKNLGKRAAHAWTPGTSGTDNNVLELGTDSILDAIIDMRKFYGEKDKTENMNICLTPDHMARIRKEDKQLFKDIMNDRNMYGFNVFEYSQAPLFTSAGVKKPFGAVQEAGDTRSSFFWNSDEVFRCFGDVELYATLRDAGLQADILSYAQRALLGVIRANSPKFLGAIR
jgi:hypothetical protein